MESLLTTDVLKALVDLLLVVVLALVGMASRHFGNSFKDEYIKGVISRADAAARDAVRYVHQTVISDLRASDPGRKLSFREASDMMKIAVTESERLLGPAGVSELSKIVGPVRPWLETKIESALHTSKVSLNPFGAIEDVGRQLLSMAGQTISGESGGSPEPHAIWTSDVQCWEEIMAEGARPDNWTAQELSTELSESSPWMAMAGPAQYEALVRFSRLIKDGEKFRRITGVSNDSLDAYPPTHLSAAPEGQ